LTMATPASFAGSGDNVMHGVAQCDIGATFSPVLTYVDGSGNAWGGNINWMAFSWLNATSGTPVPPPAPGTAVFVVPASAQVQSGGTQQFTATVVNNANPNVTWSVDGIPGGNSTVGTITSTGIYTAPTVTFPQGHGITAASVADPTAVGGAGVYVI
jgi:hypothetical protein